MTPISTISQKSTRTRTAAEIQEWTVSYLANLLEVTPEEVDVTIPFDRYGLDSLAAVSLTGDLQDWLGIDVDPTLIYDYPTIEGLVKYLSTNLN
ncbi:MAG: acyl carrier protein [Nostoc sp. ChiSLP02]|nr:acyl carrier protein [Nostoc sp. DedSLP05]MDZ8101181.1 acyl carrier protein [Nostoc sp. DedSLP01]MDZ8188305.1 acyl carrier protein [Nostoc sp. ChiSLP02]